MLRAGAPLWPILNKGASILDKGGGYCNSAAVHLCSLLRCLLFHPGTTPGSTMSESQVSTLLRRLGLYARRNINLGQDGRVLGGRLDPYAEALYQQAYILHDDVLECRPLSSFEEKFLAHCQAYIDQHRSAIRQLERQFA